MKGDKLKLQKQLQDVACKIGEFQSRATRMEPMSDKELTEYMCVLVDLLDDANEQMRKISTNS